MMMPTSRYSVLETRTTDAWLTALDAEDVPCGPVLTRESLHENDQIRANEILLELEQRRLQDLRRDWLRTLRRTADIRVNERLLETLR